MHLRVGLLCLLCTVLCGCNNFLAKTMVAPPNGGRSPELVAKQPLKAGELRIPVGPPDALVSAWILEPTTPPRATILLLHGFIANHHQLERTAKALQAAGYRAVLIDLRGHGRSTGDWITFGAVESHDLKQVLDSLDSIGLVSGKVGVVSISYGAAVAIQWAAIDPRVKAIIAIEPFTSMREVARDGAGFVLGPGRFLFSPDDIQQAVNEAGQLASFNPDDVSPLEAITQTQAQILLIHSRSDQFIPWEHSQRLHDAARDHSKLVLVNGNSHFDIWLKSLELIRKASLRWFGTWL